MTSKATNVSDLFIFMPLSLTYWNKEHKDKMESDNHAHIFVCKDPGTLGQDSILPLLVRLVLIRQQLCDPYLLPKALMPLIKQN